MQKVFTTLIQSFLLFMAQIANSSTRNRTGRIVGGSDIDISQAKFVVQVITKYPDNMYGVCGGSLVTPHLVITAAHCVRSPRVSSILVIGGATYYYTGGISRRVQTKYIPKRQVWDIAVLKLNDALIGPNIGIIQLCNTQWKIGDLTTVYGWGLTSEDELSVQNHQNLKMIQLPVVGHDECALHFNLKKIPSYYFCAGISDQIGSFHGDSGGPAVLNNQLCGVVSGGGVSPGIGLYVDINNVKSFLKRYIRTLRF